MDKSLLINTVIYTFLATDKLNYNPSREQPDCLNQPVPPLPPLGTSQTRYRAVCIVTSGCTALVNAHPAKSTPHTHCDLIVSVDGKLHDQIPCVQRPQSLCPLVVFVL